MTSKTRYRLQFKFWIDMRSEADQWIVDAIAWLKSERAYTSAVRDGLRLIVSLKQNDVSVLLEMFPWVKDKLTPPAPGGGGELEALRAELAALRTMLTGDTLKMQSAAPGNSKPLAAPKIELPRFEELDDMPTVILKKANLDSSLNFVNAMKGLQ